MLNEYAVYDTHDNGILIAIGTAREITEFLCKPINSFYCSVSRGTLVQQRYLITKLEEEEDEKRV